VLTKWIPKSAKVCFIIKTAFGGQVLARGLMTDREWAFFASFVIATGGKSGRPPADHRRVLDAIFWIARTVIYPAWTEHRNAQTAPNPSGRLKP